MHCKLALTHAIDLSSCQDPCMEVVHHKWLNFGDNFCSWNLKRISKIMMRRNTLLKHGLFSRSSNWTSCNVTRPCILQIVIWLHIRYKIYKYGHNACFESIGFNAYVLTYVSKLCRAFDWSKYKI